MMSLWMVAVDCDVAMDATGGDGAPSWPELFSGELPLMVRFFFVRDFGLT